MGKVQVDHGYTYDLVESRSRSCVSKEMFNAYHYGFGLSIIK